MASAGWHQYIADTIKELRAEKAQLQQKLAVNEGTVTRCELQIKLEEKVTDLTSRSMRDNIVIKNLNENGNNSEKNAIIKNGMSRKCIYG